MRRKFSSISKVQDISGIAEQMTGTIYPDHVAIGAYDVDIHALRGCTYPSYMYNDYPVLPFFIPFRYLRFVKNRIHSNADLSPIKSFLIFLWLGKRSLRAF